MIAALGVDELDVHPDAIGRALDAAFEHVAYVELASDQFEIERLVLVAESGVSPDNPRSRQLPPNRSGRIWASRTAKTTGRSSLIVRANPPAARPPSSVT
jgi:hypothetical protein